MTQGPVSVPARIPRPNEGKAALTGIRVIDFSRMLSGPFATSGPARPRASAASATSWRTRKA